MHKPEMPFSEKLRNVHLYSRDRVMWSVVLTAPGLGLVIGFRTAPTRVLAAVYDFYLVFCYGNTELSCWWCVHDLQKAKRANKPN